MISEHTPVNDALNNPKNTVWLVKLSVYQGIK